MYSPSNLSFLAGMNPENFTDATNEALSRARDFALEQRNAQLDVLHLAYALFNDPDGLGARVAEKVQRNSARTVTNTIERAVARLPKQDPPPEDIGPSSALLRLLRDADKDRRQAGDAYLSVDSLLRQLVKQHSFTQLLREVDGLNAETFLKALDETKGGRKVDSKHAEENFDALRKVRDVALFGAEWGR